MTKLNLDHGQNIKVIADTVDGEYADLIGKEIMVIEECETDEELQFFLCYVPGRERQDEYLGKDEVIVMGDDIEIA